MTTIAYHYESGILAYDSRSTAGHIITSDTREKMMTFGDDLKIIGAGDHHSIKQLSRLYAGEITRLHGCIDYDTILFVVEGSDVLRVGYEKDDGFWCEEIKDNIAAGSGAMFAISAMDFGKGAEDAVEYAMSRDCKTGGQIKTVDTNAQSVDT